MRTSLKVDKAASGGAWIQLRADAVQVVHGSVEGELHSFSEGRVPSLRQLHSVQRFVDPEGSHLGFRKPLPEETNDTVVLF